MKKILLLFSFWLLTATGGFSKTPVMTKTVIVKAAKSIRSSWTSPGGSTLVNAKAPTVNTVPDLTATVIMNDLNFNSASVGAARDFVVTINEINNVATQGPITFRLYKPSAFSITYTASNGNSDVYPGVSNSNGDWNFIETDNYITVTSKLGVVIGANINKAIGFSISRKVAIPTNTQQNITVSVVASSGGEQDATDNLTGITINASETSTNLTFGAVQVNPYSYSPLSALVNFSTVISGKAFIRVRGKHGKLTYVEKTFTDDLVQHSIPLVGLYPNYINAVDIRVVNAIGDTLAKNTIAVQTGSIPPNMPTSIVAAAFDETKVEPGFVLVSNYSNYNYPQTGSTFIPYAMDAYGEMRWILDYRSHPDLKTLNYEDGVSRLQNGNYFFGNSSDSKIYEVDLLGKVLNTWGMPGYLFHHEVSEKPNGNFLLTATKPGSTYKNGNPTIEDFVIEIDRQDGTIVTVWDLKESLDETRTDLMTPDGAQPDSDWFHGNAVRHDPVDNTIVVSGRTQGVVKLDYTNKVKWIMGPHQGWKTNRRGEDLQPFLLKPLDGSGNPISSTAVINGTATAPDFEWNWYQHNNTYLPNGDIMIFDNGSVREFNPSAPKYSRSVTYKIDPVNMTVQQTWAYGKERGTETYSRIISSSQFLSQTNHVLFAPGYQVPNTNGAGGKVVEIDFATKQVVSEIEISSANGFGQHRAVKMSLYP